MVYRLSITISPADLTDLTVTNVTMGTTQTLEDFTVGGDVLEGRVLAASEDDVITIESTGYNTITSTYNDISQDPNIVLEQAPPDVSKLSFNGTTYNIKDTDSRRKIANIEEQSASYANKNLDNLSVSGSDKLAVSTVVDLLGSGEKYLYNNKTYKISSTGNLVFRPSGLLSGKTNQIMVYLKKTDAAHTVDLGTTYYFNCEAPDLSEAGDYNVIYEYDPNNSHWVVGAVKKGAAS